MRLFFGLWPLFAGRRPRETQVDIPSYGENSLSSSQLPQHFRTEILDKSSRLDSKVQQRGASRGEGVSLSGLSLWRAGVPCREGDRGQGGGPRKRSSIPAPPDRARASRGAVFHSSPQQSRPRLASPGWPAKRLVLDGPAGDGEPERGPRRGGAREEGWSKSSSWRSTLLYFLQNTF